MIQLDSLCMQTFSCLYIYANSITHWCAFDRSELTFLLLCNSVCSINCSKLIPIINANNSKKIEKRCYRFPYGIDKIKMMYLEHITININNSA